MSWNIHFYETSTQKPVEEFIKSLQKSTISKLTRQINSLERFGIKLGMPHAKPIGGGLYELRVRGQQEVRIIYIFVKSNDIYMLHGFVKKTMAIQTKDLAVARIRRRDITERTK